MSEPGLGEDVTVIDYMVDTLHARPAALAVLAAMMAVLLAAPQLALALLPAEIAYSHTWEIAVEGLGGLAATLILGAVAHLVLSRVVGGAPSPIDSLRRALSIWPTLLAMFAVIALPPLLWKWAMGGGQASGTPAKLVEIAWNSVTYWALALAPAIALAERRGVAASLSASFALARRNFLMMAQLVLAVNMAAAVIYGVITFLSLAVAQFAPSESLIGVLIQLLLMAATAGASCVFSMAWPAGYLKLRARRGDSVEASVADTFE